MSLPYHGADATVKRNWRSFIVKYYRERRGGIAQELHRIVKRAVAVHRMTVSRDLQESNRDAVYVSNPATLMVLEIMGNFQDPAACGLAHTRFVIEYQRYGSDRDFSSLGDVFDRRAHRFLCLPYVCLPHLSMNVTENS